MPLQLMLFNEVTSALDPELVGEVLRVMEQMARGDVTMITEAKRMGWASPATSPPRSCLHA